MSRKPLTLVDFIDAGMAGEGGPLHVNSLRNAYVQHPDFRELYVRWTKRYLDEKRMSAPTSPVLDIARIASKNPGTGQFTNLIRWLRDTYPTLAIYVESVMEPKFEDTLIHLGFVRRPDSNPPSYYLLGQPRSY